MEISNVKERTMLIKKNNNCASNRFSSLGFSQGELQKERPTISSNNKNGYGLHLFTICDFSFFSRNVGSNRSSRNWDSKIDSEFL